MKVIPANPLDKMHVTGKFGEDRGTSLHNGVDLRARTSKTIYSVLDGIVERASNRPAKDKTSNSYGNVIVIYHGLNKKTQKYTYSLYAHLNTMKVSAGDFVRRRQEIATSGNSGMWRGGNYHVHLEILESDIKLGVCVKLM